MDKAHSIGFSRHPHRMVVCQAELAFVLASFQVVSRKSLTIVATVKKDRYRPAGVP
jgi:hypothetical protein